MIKTIILHICWRKLKVQEDNVMISLSFLAHLRKKRYVATNRKITAIATTATIIYLLILDLVKRIILLEVYDIQYNNYEIYCCVFKIFIYIQIVIDLEKVIP